MAGPTAKLLAFDSHQMGFRALDLGHIAKCYDYFMRGRAKDWELWKADE